MIYLLGEAPPVNGRPQPLRFSGRTQPRGTVPERPWLAWRSPCFRLLPFQAAPGSPVLRPILFPARPPNARVAAQAQ